MLVGTTNIVTPYDNPSQYQPDWRHLVAKCWHDDPEVVLPPEFSDDKFIQTQAEFLDQPQGNIPGVINVEWLAQQRAYDIYSQRDETNVRDYLDPLLLTDQPYSVIARDLGQLPETIEHYERVYWACRAHDGVASPAEVVKTSFAMGVDTELRPNTPMRNVWRAIGATMGYTALTWVWNWAHPAGATQTETDLYRMLNKVNVGNLFKLAVTGRMEPIDMIGFFGQYVGYERMKHDTRAGGETNEVMETLLGMMQMLSPKMRAVAQDTSGLEIMINGDQKMLAARNTIDATVISDSGPMATRTAISLELEKTKSSLRKMKGRQQL
jgi:hypothetical protein